MARHRTAANLRTGGLAIEADLAGFAEAESGLRAVQAQVGRELDEQSKLAAIETVLPDAKRRAGNLKVEGQSIAESLVVRKIRGGARLTSRMRGVRARAVGLLEFGGTVSQPIVPRRGTAEGGKQAIYIPGSAHPVARVRTARHFRAHNFMYGARDDKLTAFGQNLRERIVEFFRRRGFEVS